MAARGLRAPGPIEWIQAARCYACPWQGVPIKVRKEKDEPVLKIICPICKAEI